MLGHTRWASVGIISQANAHPLNSEEVGRTDGPYVIAALNGDVDNYAELRLSEDLRLPAEITTDAKVIPTLVSRRLAEGIRAGEAFRHTVARFEGSVAIAASTAVDPDELHLALRGSGQSLYVGLAEDAFVVASEPYGLVEETRRYVRMDGETTQRPDRRAAPGRRGDARRDAAGSRYDGVRSCSARHEVRDRRDHHAGHRPAPTFPTSCSRRSPRRPQSFRKTLRGKIVDERRAL